MTGEFDETSFDCLSRFNVWYVTFDDKNSQVRRTKQEDSMKFQKEALLDENLTTMCMR